MAFKLKCFLLLLLLLLLIQQLSAAGAKQTLNNASSSSMTLHNRKLLLVNGFDAKKGVDHEVSWELRAAPLGPDPLHHHGADPKPRTP
ncbi:hypothetical protein QVD17_01735 [Tagetes erecta]|uniref:Uncharacterized protein n=1 Tax=Tagetes erecta TaxID=13708 RepID=A0AAD8P8F2_TARER|nr:hypothetical protein QVD17_01735 [Tagetes erecta]